MSAPSPSEQDKLEDYEEEEDEGKMHSDSETPKEGDEKMEIPSPAISSPLRDPTGSSAPGAEIFPASTAATASLNADQASEDADKQEKLSRSTAPECPPFAKAKGTLFGPDVVIILTIISLSPLLYRISFPTIRICLTLLDKACDMKRFKL